MNVPPLQGFSDERHGDVVVVRPMREHTLKEVAFYNRLFAVPSVFTPAIDTKVRCGIIQRGVRGGQHTLSGPSCVRTSSLGAHAAHSPAEERQAGTRPRGACMEGVTAGVFSDGDTSDAGALAHSSPDLALSGLMV